METKKIKQIVSAELKDRFFLNSINEISEIKKSEVPKTYDTCAHGIYEGIQKVFLTRAKNKKTKKAENLAVVFYDYTGHVPTNSMYYDKYGLVAIFVVQEDEYRPWIDVEKYEKIEEEEN